jgi:glycerol-3-phosphate dehydrogenase (NAD(P)+)
MRVNPGAAMTQKKNKPPPIAQDAPIAVLGAGSYGTALAIQLSRSGHPTTLWGRDAEQIGRLAAERVNARYLPGCRFPARLQPVTGLEAAIRGTPHIIVAVPSHAVRALLEQLRPLLRPGQKLACAAKGLEPESCKLMHEVFAETLGADFPLAIVSGPTFAKEVGKGMPTAVTVASSDPQVAAEFAAFLHSGVFRAYTATDVVGVEVGGAVKNVLAIAVGAADGLGFGANTRALMIKRGLAEIMRLGEALGGERDTLMGLAGLGDLLLTCTDDQSRNRRLGLALAAGKGVEQAQAEIGQVVEGVRVAREVARLAARLNVEMPISQQVARVLHEGVSPIEAFRVLTSRPSKAESA